MIITISIADPVTGLFTGGQSTADESIIAQQTPPGLLAIEGSHDHRNRCVDFSTGEVVPYQPDPPPDTETHTYVWNTETELWDLTPTLAYHRKAARARINAARELALCEPLVVNGRVFDADEVSQAKITRAVQLSQYAPEGFELEWTLHDNTTATLDKAALIAVGLALGQRTVSLYDLGRTLKATIDAANSEEELNAITWN